MVEKESAPVQFATQHRFNYRLIIWLLLACLGQPQSEDWFIEQILLSEVSTVFQSELLAGPNEPMLTAAASGKPGQDGEGVSQVFRPQGALLPRRRRWVRPLEEATVVEPEEPHPVPVLLAHRG